MKSSELLSVTILFTEIASEVICPPMTLEACVPSASACGAPKSLGDLCLVHFSTRMKPQQHKRGVPALRSSCSKDTGGASASVGGTRISTTNMFQYHALSEIKGGRENQISYLKISKLALAFAIIHSKPPGKCSKEYTEHLARTVSEQDFGWKWKVEVLETEVLRLRQELLLNRISPRFCLENRKQDTSAETLLGQESINPTSYSSQLEDSGCDVCNDSAFDSLGIASDFHQSEHNVNTSKYWLERFPPLNLGHTSKEQSLTAPVHFLQRLLEIRKLSERGVLQADFSELENDSFTICNSVSQLLDGLTFFYNSPEFPAPGFLTEGVCVLLSLITDTKLSNHVLKKCFKKIEEFKKNLIQIILRNRSVNRVQSVYDIAQYENIFLLCMILEQLLQNETEESNISSSDYGGEEKIKFLKNLDQVILHLSDEFPLFSLYLWRVSVLLNSGQMQID
ncbi:meiosis-specific protein MEI4 isoform X2 [Agelaius phoeniceus]|uniref:meiosis-specific protein MEI4 isoform X2 n=1 Tax=Agelaius phoeniceus TaxID=39638 RepID=UPI004054B324